MAELKTQPTGESVEAFLESLEDEGQRADCQVLIGMMAKAAGAEAVMWGAKIVGFGRYHYRYATGREGDWFLTGFSPRKGEISLYIMAGFDGYEEIMKRLGKYRTGKSCLYVRRLANVDMEALNELIVESVRHMRELYGEAAG